MENKKGQINFIKLIPVFAIIILIGFIFLSTGAEIIQIFTDGSAPASNVAVDNETQTLINGTAVTLSNTPLANGTSVIVAFSSNGTTVPSADYTVASSPAAITLINNTLNNTAMGINYTYVSGSDNYVVNVSRNANAGIVEFGDFGATMGLVMAAIVILGFLIVGLGRFTGAL